MPLYSYVAYDEHGARIKKELESINLESAKNEIFDAGLTLIDISAVQVGASHGSLNKKLNIDDLEFFTSQLSLLLNNGLRLDNALQLLRKTSSSADLEAICGFLTSKIREGVSLSTALKDVSSFDQVYVSLISVGETAGNLPQVLNALTASLKFKKQLSQKISQAIAYPIMIMVVCLLAVVFIFNFVVPRMSTLFDSAENLPWYTELLLDTTEIFNQYQFLIFGIVIFISVSLSRLWKTNPNFSRKIEALIINFPMLGIAVSTVERVRYCETMTMTLQNGLTLERAMMLANETIKVKRYQIEAISSRENIKQGKSLAESISKCSFFNDTYVGLIEVGEASGNLDIIFDEIATRSREQFDGWVAKFTAVLEPILILFMAMIVGSVVIVMLMSIISVQDINF